MLRYAPYVINSQIQILPRYYASIRIALIASIDGSPIKGNKKAQSAKGYLLYPKGRNTISATIDLLDAQMLSQKVAQLDQSLIQTFQGA